MIIGSLANLTISKISNGAGEQQSLVLMQTSDLLNLRQLLAQKEFSNKRINEPNEPKWTI
jgi:hypothetical protein